MAVNSRETYQRGLEIRRSVLGDAYVNRSLNNATEFSQPMQELVTEYCWGAVWGREGLPKTARSMVNIAMIAALNRPHELKLHVAGALRNGVTREEIREIILQVAIYCGVPAGIDALRLATEAIAAYEKEATDAG